MQIKHIFVALDGHHGGPDRATLRMRRLWVENFGGPLEVGKRLGQEKMSPLLQQLQADFHRRKRASPSS